MNWMYTLILAGLFACGDEIAPVEEVKEKPKSTNSVGNADVTSVFARQEKDGKWTFHVSVEHPDVNWNDFADGWAVVLPDGVTLQPDPFQQFTKHFRHPHVDEQPFTRTQKGIEIPDGVDTVIVRAHDKKDGWGGKEVEVNLNVRFGEQFSVKRAP
ncbi:MAG: hypothetical protein H8D71_01420 [Deltaproteobacteria bacterium]|jgi:hypothetical protein|nr:hypothetical protein [Deltaproteobacteria bacterium]